MTIADLRDYFFSTLAPLYDERERRAVWDLVAEHYIGWRPAQLASRMQEPIPDLEYGQIIIAMDRLAMHEPVQYVLGEAWFDGLKLEVNHAVLIPRPETEELVHWAAKELKAVSQPFILDAGTGSGCIALALKKHLSGARVTGWDVSLAALMTAEHNAQRLQLDVFFEQADIFNPPPAPAQWDAIVSNPPYIPASEAAAMPDRVVKFEPGSALFTPDNDAMLFYRQLARLGRRLLKTNGLLFLEIHEERAAEVEALLQEEGWTNIETRKDLSGKPRMVRAKNA